MCSSKTKLQSSPQNLSRINGRPVLQQHSKIVPLYERRNSLKKTTNAPSPPPVIAKGVKNNNIVGTKVKTSSLTTPPVSPEIKSPRQPAIKRGNNIDPNGLSSSAEKVLSPKSTANKTVTLLKKPKKSSGGIGSPNSMENSSLKYSSSLIVEAPGSIAAARREQVAIAQVQRKMKIAHYGRTKSAKYEGKVSSLDPSFVSLASPSPREEKRCSFITPNSDPLYIAYHDEEWGVPVHDDNMLFELLVLTGAQVRSDWTSVLKKRQEFRDAFSGFDPETVSKYNEKKITSTSVEYGIELSQIRGAVDNSNRILEIKKIFGSFDKYLWDFVNKKPIATQYKAYNKIPVKTSKSETISKDMVKRGFRYGINSG
ncbi:hypothetical protein RND71_019782 [Anisodus tanguticus]|uniref:DNA-3-methyladenine glycosylase I n=1 Tax=Anisodus tanguticus TaxID=243964 RepID=A0AAE1RZP4_9SOLA|nr:hypothetical protein RND71_019782 [Anisodus tanguticus]